MTNCFPHIHGLNGPLFSLVLNSTGLFDLGWEACLIARNPDQLARAEFKIAQDDFAA